MCCESNSYAKRSLLRDLQREGRKTFVGWKVVDVFRDDGCLRLHPQFGEGFFRPGTNHAQDNGKLWTAKRYDQINPRGIHVFKERPLAIWGWNRWGIRTVAIPVRCHVDDLVRVDNHQAVLRKVSIPKKVYARALKARSKSYVPEHLLRG